MEVKAQLQGQTQGEQGNEGHDYNGDNFTVLAGATVALSIQVDSTAPLSYQWSVNRTNFISTTTNTLTLGNLHLTEAAFTRCWSATCSARS